MSDFENKVRSFLVEQFRIEIGSIERTTPLFSNGLLDSFAMVELVAFVEAESGSRIKARDLTLENFDSLERISGFIYR